MRNRDDRGLHDLSSRQRASPRIRCFIGASLASLGILFVGWVAAFAIVGQYSGRILPGVRAGSVDLGGLSLQDGRRRLEEAYAKLAIGVITIETPIGPARFTFREIGRAADIETMLAVAADSGRLDNPALQIGSLVATAVQGREIPLQVRLDRALLAARLGDIARTTRIAPKDAEVTAGADKITVVPAVAGSQLDAASLAIEIVGKLRDPLAPTELTAARPFIELPPARADAEARSAAAMGRRMAADITVRAGSSTYRIAASTVLKSLTFGVSPDHDYGPLVDTSVFRADLEKFAGKAKRDSVNATFVTDRTGRPTRVRASADGMALNVNKTIVAIGALLAARRDGSVDAVTLDAVTYPVKPALSTGQARAYLRRMEKVSGWTVRFTPGDSNGDGANIRIPARTVNGAVVAPGEVFSFLQAVGPIDEAHGFKQGGVIVNGRSRPTGAIGGGICSASTAMFNAVLRAGFEIVERRAHFYFIDRYPVGLDATVFSNGSTTVDLRWRNDSQYPVLVRGYSTSTSVTFELWTVPDGRTVRLVPARPPIWDVVKAITRTELVTTLKPGQRHQEEYPADGYETLVRRVVADAAGATIHRDAFRSRYSKVDGLLHIGASD